MTDLDHRKPNLDTRSLLSHHCWWWHLTSGVYRGFQMGFGLTLPPLIYSTVQFVKWSKVWSPPLIERVLCTDVNDRHCLSSLPTTPSQHGFKAKHSTTTALIPLSTSIAIGFNQRKPVSRKQCLLLSRELIFKLEQLESATLFDRFYLKKDYT